MSWRQLKNKHAGKTAWVFGKGASLDDYLESPDSNIENQSGQVRLVVNEAALVVSKPNYFFAHDITGIDRAMCPEKWGFKNGYEVIDSRVRRKYDPDCVAILVNGPHPSHLVYAARYKDRCPHMFGYRKGQFDTKLLKLSVDELVETHALYAESATIQSACHFAKLIGCVKVVVVGVDGGKGVAKVFNNMSCKTGPWYTKNRYDTHRILKSMGMPFTVWGEKPWQAP